MLRSNNNNNNREERDGTQRNNMCMVNENDYDMIHYTLNHRFSFSAISSRSTSPFAWVWNETT